MTYRYNTRAYTMVQVLRDYQGADACTVFLTFNLWNVSFRRRNWTCIPDDMAHDWTMDFILDEIPNFPAETHAQVMSTSTWIWEEDSWTDKKGVRRGAWADKSTEANTARAYVRGAFHNHVSNKWKHYKRASSPTETATKSSVEIMEEIQQSYMETNRREYMSDNKELIQHLNDYINIFTGDERELVQKVLIPVRGTKPWEKFDMSVSTWTRRKKKYITDFKNHLEMNGAL